MKRYKYSMRHNWITAFNTGQLVPIFYQPVVPNDIWHGRSMGFFRMEPLEVPAYMQYQVFAHFFYVKFRDLDPDFENLVSDPDSVVSSGAPYTSSLPAAFNIPIWKALGLPSNSTDPTSVNLFPVMAYNKVWNDMFRNEGESEVALTYNTNLHSVSHPSSDYYGSWSDEAQHGAEEVINTGGATETVRNIRLRMKEQKERERRSKFGKEYNDVLKTDYGVESRFQQDDRPIHLARGKTVMGISEVVATATSATENTGALRGHGISSMPINFRPRRLDEHGCIIGVCYARPRLQMKYGTKVNYKPIAHQLIYNPTQEEPIDIVENNEVLNSGGVAIYAYKNRYEHLRKPIDIIAGPMLDVAREPWTAHKPVSGFPVLSLLKKVDSPVQIFQDQTATRIEVGCYFAHNIKKHSLVKPAPIRV